MKRTACAAATDIATRIALNVTRRAHATVDGSSTCRPFELASAWEMVPYVALGFIAGVLTLTPYYHWRWEHNIHHASSGHLDKRGVGYEACKAVNPRIVFCTISGYGMTGPYKDMPSHGIAYDTWAGQVPVAHDEDGSTYMPEHTSIGIHAGPLYGALGILAAWLLTRQRFVGQATFEFGTMLSFAIPGTVIGVKVAPGDRVHVLPAITGG